MLCLEPEFDFIAVTLQGDFIGKGALDELKSQETSRRLALIAVEGDPSGEESTLPHGMEIIRNETKEVSSSVTLMRGGGRR